MPGQLVRLAGPVASGKSQVARSMLADGEAEVLADTSAIYAAISGEVRDAQGK